MTEDELKRIEERESKATKGPWETGDGSPEFYHEGRDAVVCLDLATIEGMAVLAKLNFHLPNWENDSEFIAHARTDIPALVAEVRRLNKVIETMCSSQLEGTRKGGYCV